MPRRHVCQTRQLAQDMKIDWKTTWLSDISTGFWRHFFLFTLSLHMRNEMDRPMLSWRLSWWTMPYGHNWNLQGIYRYSWLLYYGWGPDHDRSQVGCEFCLKKKEGKILLCSLLPFVVTLNGFQIIYCSKTGESFIIDALALLFNSGELAKVDYLHTEWNTTLIYETILLSHAIMHRINLAVRRL